MAKKCVKIYCCGAGYVYYNIIRNTTIVLEFDKAHNILIRVLLCCIAWLSRLWRGYPHLSLTSQLDATSWGRDVDFEKQVFSKPPRYSLHLWCDKAHNILIWVLLCCIAGLSRLWRGYPHLSLTSQLDATSWGMRSGFWKTSFFKAALIFSASMVRQSAQHLNTGFTLLHRRIISPLASIPTLVAYKPAWRDFVGYAKRILKKQVFQSRIDILCIYGAAKRTTS